MLERREPSYTVGGNVNWYGHYGEQYEGFLKTKNRATIQPCNPIPGHISREKHNLKGSMYHNVHCSIVYNNREATYMSIDRGMDKPKCPLTEEWIKKMWYIQTVEYYSVLRKNEIKPLSATRMDLDSVILSEVCQREEEISYDIPHTWTLKRNYTNELTYKTNRCTDVQKELMVGGVRTRDRDSLGVWNGHAHTAIL